ncbi:MAG TPA: integrase, partial [Clostridium sp.]|nr:integrase [Clostridium sp.]
MVKENTVTDLEAENKSPVEQSLDDFRDYLEFNNMSSNTIHVYLFA